MNIRSCGFFISRCAFPCSFECPCASVHPIQSKHCRCGSHEIDWFGIYDCYPICFIRGLEAAGVCGKGDSCYMHSRFWHLAHTSSSNCSSRLALEIVQNTICWAVSCLSTFMVVFRRLLRLL